MKISIASVFVAIDVACCPAVRAQTWTLVNPTDETYVDEPVRLKLDLPDWATPGKYRLLCNGRQIGYQMEQIDGRLEMTKGARLSVDGATGEFITVLYPRPVKRVDQVRLTLPAAAYYPKRDKRTGQTEKQPREILVTLDYDRDRLYPRAVVEVPKFNRTMHIGVAQSRGPNDQVSVRAVPLS